MPMRWGQWVAVAKATWQRASGHQVPVLSAAVAFRIFLAIVPSLVAGVAIFSLVTDPAELQDLVANLRGVVPGEALGFVEDQLTETVTAANGGIAIAGVAGGLWAATGGASALVLALNNSWGLTESRNFVKQRLVALAITFALLLTLVALFVVLILGPTIVLAILPSVLEGGPVPALIGLGRYLAAVVLLIAFFAYVFWIGPNHEQGRFRWVTPGAILAVVGWLLLSFLFSIYASRFGNYADTYGLFAGVILLLVWLQLSFTVLLVGAELDVELAARREASGDAVGAPPVHLGPDAEIEPVVPRPAVPRKVTVEGQEPARRRAGRRS